MRFAANLTARTLPGLLLLAMSACGIPLSTMHGPVPLPVGTSSVSVGLGPVFLEEMSDADFVLDALVLGGYFSARQSVSERLEMGASGGMFNGLTADVKYNLLRKPLHVSANLALSTGVIPDIDFWGDDDVELLGNLGVHPALLVGTERVYGGAKLMIFPGSTHLKPWNVLFVGGSFGRATRIVPELGWLHDPADGEATWFGGLTLQHRGKLW